MVAQDSILQTFLAEQKDDLCGPRPQKSFLNPQSAGESTTADFGPDVQSSTLMQLLQQSFEVSQIANK